jgi:hypothetical protein
MASVPTPGPGSIIANNMREAREHGMSRNMATPSTYYWFYQKRKSDYKKFDPYFAAFGNFNLEPPGIPANILLWAQDGLEPQTRMGKMV